MGEVTCTYCGKLLYRNQYRLRQNKTHFCNTDCKASYQKHALKGDKNPCWRGGKVEVRCAICNKKYYRKPDEVKRCKNSLCSRECLGEYRRRMNSGINSYCWKGGLCKPSSIVRSSTNYNNWIKSVLRRDEFKCKCCGNNYKLNAHHIKALFLILNEHNIKTKEDVENCSELWDIDNGITLCIRCHRRFHNLYGRYKFTKDNLVEFLKNKQISNG